MDDYGSCELRRHDDGSLEVVRADRTVGISAELLVEAADHGLSTDAAGRLVIAGQVRYLPVRFDRDGAVIICDRVDHADTHVRREETT